MTKKQRAEVVELLRCAADHVVRAYYDAGSALSVSADCLESRYFKYAIKCEQQASRDLRLEWPADGSNRIAPLLEAAARIEEGRTP